jgi:hypothetical protein
MGGLDSILRQAIPSDEMESAFQQWFGQWAQRSGLAPNPDDPLHRYDYREAYRMGIEPSINRHDGRYHWPSKTPDGRWLKAPDHPTAWKETYMQQYGVDPDDVGAQSLDQAPPSGLQRLLR